MSPKRYAKPETPGTERPAVLARLDPSTNAVLTSMSDSMGVSKTTLINWSVAEFAANHNVSASFTGAAFAAAASASLDVLADSYTQNLTSAKSAWVNEDAITKLGGTPE